MKYSEDSEAEFNRLLEEMQKVFQQFQGKILNCEKPKVSSARLAHMTAALIAHHATWGSSSPFPTAEREEAPEVEGDKIIYEGRFGQIVWKPSQETLEAVNSRKKLTGE